MTEPQGVRKGGGGMIGDVIVLFNIYPSPIHYTISLFKRGEHKND